MRAGITTLTRLATVAAGQPPRDGEVSWSLTTAQFAWLTAGVDWQRLSAGPLPAWTE